MFVAQITGVAEQMAILVSKACQVIALQKTVGNFQNEEIEIMLVDFTTGKETVLMRREKVSVYGEVVAQGGNLQGLGTCLIEVSDGKDLDLNANKSLRINLYSLTNAGVDYTINTIECGIKGGKPAVWEQLIIPNGVTSQKFPIVEGNLLVLPVANLNDIRLLFNDNSEVRMNHREIGIRAKAVNGLIKIYEETVGTETVNQFVHGFEHIFVIDLKLENEFVKKNVSEVEINLGNDGGSYTLYKINDLDKAGFDWR